MHSAAAHRVSHRAYAPQSDTVSHSAVLVLDSTLLAPCPQFRERAAHSFHCAVHIALARSPITDADAHRPLAAPRRAAEESLARVYNRRDRVIGVPVVVPPARIEKPDQSLVNHRRA